MPRTFWISHLVVPGLLYLAAATLISAFDLDVRIANTLFYDRETGQWIAAHASWANEFLHRGGRDAIRLAVFGAACAFLASHLSETRRHWRRPAGFVFLSMLLGIGVVAALKGLTNIDCPWSLEGFGGNRPYIGILGDRPDSLPRAACFPGAHASSGFALTCFYFLLRERSHLASAALTAGLLIGVMFAIGQEARGAHFISHDLTSAIIVWYVLTATYALGFSPNRLPDRCNTRQPSRGVGIYRR
jgi:membrane-associated PAP2 superfamily phosphatase